MPAVRAAALAIAVVLAVTAPARAQMDAGGRSGALTPGQRDGERKAQAAFAAGRYEESVEIYANLWAEHHDPIYLRNIGRCYQRLRNPDRAIGSFEEYLAKARRLSPAERQEIEGYLRELRALKAEQESAARHARPEPAPAPSSAAPPAAPAPPTAVPAPALPAAPEAVPPPAVLAPPEVRATPTPADDGGRGWRRAGAGALIAAGGLAVAGGGFLWSSWSRYQDANHHCADLGGAACDAAADTVKTRNWISRFLFAGAAVAAVFGGTALYLHPAPAEGSSLGLVAGAVGTF